MKGIKIEVIQNFVTWQPCDPKIGDIGEIVSIDFNSNIIFMKFLNGTAKVALFPNHWLRFIKFKHSNLKILCRI